MMHHPANSVNMWKLLTHITFIAGKYFHLLLYPHLNTEYLLTIFHVLDLSYDIMESRPNMAEIMNRPNDLQPKFIPD